MNENLIDKGQKEKIDFSKKQYLISDWDGTLVESFENILEAFATVMEGEFKVKKDDAKEFMTVTNGATLSSQFIGAAKKFTNKDVEDTIPYEEAFWKLMEGKTPKTIEGTRDFLEKAKEMGIHITVWSGTRSDFLEDQIKTLGLEFLIDFWVGTSSGTAAKNKAPLFSKIIEFYKIPEVDLIEKSIVFGDGKGDIQSGKDLGIQTVGFLNNGKNNQKLEGSGADLLVERLSDLLQKFQTE
ncbi:MAG: hypothetical protein A2152_01285 [Candidatus Levybacteria bacterium RBG_16_35_6]|nr:MAG: hypothetical protein A2152_01285 [Candidatus Levybacteria bacterium RBG_16_35_6]